MNEESIDARNSLRELLAYDMNSKLTQYLPYDIQAAQATTQADLDNIKKVGAEIKALYEKHAKKQVDIWRDVV